MRYEAKQITTTSPFFFPHNISSFSAKRHTSSPFSSLPLKICLFPEKKAGPRLPLPSIFQVQTANLLPALRRIHDTKFENHPPKITTNQPFLNDVEIIHFRPQRFVVSLSSNIFSRESQRWNP